MKGEDKVLLPSVYLEGNWSQNLLRPRLYVTHAIGALDEGRTLPGTNARDLGTQQDIESNLLSAQANPPGLCIWQPLVDWCATHVADLPEADRMSLDIDACTCHLGQYGTSSGISSTLSFHHSFVLWAGLHWGSHPKSSFLGIRSSFTNQFTTTPVQHFYSKELQAPLSPILHHEVEV